MSPVTVLFHTKSRSFKLCVLFAVMMSQRSVSRSPAWFCCANMTRCCAGAETVTTVCTRAWWRSLFLTSSGPSPVRPYRKCANGAKHHTVSMNAYFLLCPGALTQAIRNFAKSLESWLTNAMMNIPEEMVRIKVHSLCAPLTVEQQYFWQKQFMGLQGH